MADVKLTIAGRPYDVHCADGQEAQLIQLAGIVDAKARGIQGGTEVRQLLFAALMLADETQEAQSKAGNAEPQLDSLRAAIALAESRESTARDELRAAVSRESAALDQVKQAAEREAALSAELDKLRQGAPVVPVPVGPDHGRALGQIADRIEELAAKVEQIP
ncbi:MAG: cell division protein ZapA [Sphingopyxis sp.]|nr:cell division protein ZapA [Sphingopyxis sp.]